MGAIGIGDDAALWEPTPGIREVLTTDALIEDVHFRHATTSWLDLGWKALAENVSDIAAMGARPNAGVRHPRPACRTPASRTWRTCTVAFAERWQRRGTSSTIAGGDTVSSPVTMLSITVVGELDGEGCARVRRGSPATCWP